MEAFSFSFSLPSCSLATSVLASRSRWGHVFDNPHGAVGGNEGLIGNAPDIGFAHFIEIVHLVEEFTPIVIARLIQGELQDQAFVAAEPAQQSGFAPRHDA